VTFGPRKEKDFSKKINKRMRSKALYTTLSQKLRDDEVIFLDSLAIAEPKTKEAKAILAALGGVATFSKLNSKKKNVALIAIPENDLNAKRSFQNIGSVVVEEVRNLNPVDVLTYKYIVVASPEKAIEFLISKPGVKVVKETEKDKEVSEVKKSTVAKKPSRSTVQADRKVMAKKASAKKATTKKAASKPASLKRSKGGKTARKSVETK